MTQQGESSLEMLLSVIDSGSMTGTNKLSLLLALIDLVPQMPSDLLEIDINTLAEKVVEISWNHTEPFHGSSPLKQLSVNNRGGLVVHQIIMNLKEAFGQKSDFASVRERVPKAVWQQQMSVVATNLKKNPLKFLQNIEGTSLDFLFPLDFSNNTLKLFPHAKTILLKWGSNLRVLVEARYIQFVSRLNMGEVAYSELENYLFGSERFMPNENFRQELASLQNNRCILTGELLPQTKSHRALDHFVPWSKTRISQIQNLTLTSSKLNSSKRDFLPDLQMIASWVEFQNEKGEALNSLASNFKWPNQTGVTSVALKNLYEAMPVGMRVFSKNGLVTINEKDKEQAIKILTTSQI